MHNQQPLQEYSSYWTCIEVSFIYNLFYAALHFNLVYDQSVSHVVIEAFLCFPYSLPHCFLWNSICILHGQYVYIAVNTILYLYALPIDSSLLLTSVFA